MGRSVLEVTWLDMQMPRMQIGTTMNSSESTAEEMEAVQSVINEEGKNLLERDAEKIALS